MSHLLAAVTIPYDLAVLGAIAFVIVVGVTFLYALLAAVFPAPQERDRPVSLREAVTAVRPPRYWWGRLDRGFARLVRDTMLGLTPERAVEVMLLSGAAVGLVAYLVDRTFEVAAVAVAVGGAAPLVVFMLMADRRRNAIQDQLPDGCFQLARTLRAGLSLDQALAVAAEYSPEPLADVFRRAAARIELGLAGPVALGELSEDVRLTDFDGLVSVLDLHRRTGGNLPALLDRFAAGVRDRNQFRGYFRTVTRLSVVTAGFLALIAPLGAIGYLMFDRDIFLNFFRSDYGLAMFVLAVILELAGLLWVTWLVRRQQAY